MPLYDYRCRACSKVTEVRHGFREAYDATCPDCGGDLARVFNPTGILFKGSGFYLTDSRKAAESAASASAAASSPSPSSATPPAAGSATPSTGGDSGSKNSESSAA